MNRVSIEIEREREKLDMKKKKTSERMRYTKSDTLHDMSCWNCWRREVNTSFGVYQVNRGEEKCWK